MRASIFTSLNELNVFLADNSNDIEDIVPIVLFGGYPSVIVYWEEVTYKKTLEDVKVLTE
jgi:hypothetical protein